MPASIRTLDQITVASPCDADWNSMIGNDEVRFCEHCHLHVTNLSAMTRREAERLVERSRGRLCLRYLQNADGEMLTRQSSPRLHRINRRVSRLAAGAFSATLSVASAAAQASSAERPINSRQVTELKVTAAKDSMTSEIEVKLEAVMTLAIQGDVAIRQPADPLALAVFKNDFAAAAQLIPLTRDLNKWDPYTNRNALSYAIEQGNLEMVNLLLAAGADANSSNKDGRTPTMQLNASATVELVDRLLVAGAAVNARDESGVSVLSQAVRNCSPAVIKELIGSGARVDAKDKYNTTVLMNAVWNDDVAVTKMLLAAGADVNARNKDGECAMSLAAMDENSKALRAIIDAGGGLDLSPDQRNELLFRAAGSNDADVVKILIETGADPNAKDDDGATPLMEAADNGRPEILKVLIDSGVDLNAADNDGFTALMRADAVENMRVLLDAGADMTRRNHAGKTALALAIEKKDDEVAKFLKSRGAVE